MLTRYKDIKALLFIGYLFGYPLAIAGPVLVDPRLESHVVFHSRTYPHAILCIPIYVVSLALVLTLFKLKSNLRTLYLSVCIFLVAVVASLPIFRPEFPHGNLLAVAIVAGLLFAFTIFVWSVGQAICADAKSAVGEGEATLGYLKELLSFVRQATFAGIGVFSGLLYGAFTVEFEYINTIATSAPDKFLLRINAAAQIGFYAIFAVAGPVRYFFMMSLRVLSNFKEMANRLDSTSPTDPQAHRSKRHSP
jgi:hypothetical protein